MLQRQFMFLATWDFEACFLAQNTDHTKKMTLYISYDTSMLTLTCSKRVCYAFDMSITVLLTKLSFLSSSSTAFSIK